MPAQNVSSAKDAVFAHSEAQAQALIRAITGQELDPFRYGPRSPQEVARETGEPLERVLRLIKRWEKLGVLEVKETRKRAGRPVRLYGLSATSYFIPLHLLPQEELLQQVNGPLQQQAWAHLAAALVGQAGVSGTQVELSAQQWGAFLATKPGQTLDPAAVADFPAIANAWATLHLSYADACALRDELGAVLDRYLGREGPQEYLAHLLLTPLVT